MVTRILPILTLLLLLPVWAIDARFFRPSRRRALRILLWLPSVVLLAGLCFMAWNEAYTAAADLWKARLLAATLTLAVPEAVFALFLVPALVRRRRRRVSILERIGQVLACIVGFGMFYASVFGWRQSEVVEREITLRDLPASFDGYRIVQLSDLHVGTLHGHPAVLETLVRDVNALRPDIVCFTGDLVNYRPDEQDEFRDILSGFKARDGVLSIMGNHDYLCYFRWPSPLDSVRAIAQVQDAERQMGWRLLLNESHVVRRGAGQDSLVFVGLENDGPPRFPAEADYPRAMQGISDSACRIVLQHDPTYWRREVLKEPRPASLQLSGHTHGMQLRIFGWSPSSWIYSEWGGLFENRDAVPAKLYVNQGFGSVMIPFRLGAWPEITLITLRTPEK
ncbi:MAG: metallophosphoesterase [Alloprevotella sp.]|nr:metallophosphoesterase [Alloprevotella sp.]MBR1652073.1 metallophosphoesterase [Alloprevotella sp.]